MKLFKWQFFLSMLLITPVLDAQNKDDKSISYMEESMEQLSMDEEEDKNWEDELEELSHRLKEPVNINTATKEQLEQFPFLSDIQIENILSYVYIYGQMQTVYELQLVEGMDKRTIDLLLPFICIRPITGKRRFPQLKTILKYGRNEMISRLDIPLYTRKGYETGTYLGPSVYHSLKYSFHYSDYLQIGVTGEKDAGEPFFALHDRKGYDYYSFYFLLHHLGRIKTLALGNYRLSFGQGLVLNTNFNLGKTFSLSTIDNRSSYIRKHGSTDEFSYFRGVATTVELSRSFQCSAFYSNRSMDGTVKNGIITSIYKTGLHRTDKEADKINAFTLQLTGGNVTYQKHSLKLGLTGIYYYFNRPYEPQIRKYSKYNLRGNYFHNVGFDYKYHWNHFTVAGEGAIGKQGYALVNQLKYNILTGYQLLIVHRYYAYNYWSMFAHSFGENSTPQNENGWYMALEADPFAHWHLFASLDLFSFPWWKYRISKPSQGVDGMLQVVYSPKSSLSTYISYRYKQKERDVSGTKGELTLPVFHHQLRYRLVYTLKKYLLRTTLDYNHFHSQGKEGSQGYQLTQLCSYAFSSFPLKMAVQATCFHTDDYDSRVYASEKGLLYTFYTPSFYGKGYRISAHFRYDLNKLLMCIVKFGETVYQDRDEIGSGNDLIGGGKKADLQMQIRMKF